MRLIVETYGRAVLLVVAGSFLVFFIIYIMGSLTYVYGMEPEESYAVSKEKFEAYYSEDEPEVEVVGKIYSGKVLYIDDYFSSLDQITDIRVVDVEDANSGEKKSEYILSDGKNLYFKNRGMYRITISLLDEDDISSKRHFYIYVR